MQWNSCFISDTRLFFGAFLGPIFLILFFNFLIFIAGAIVLIKHLLSKSTTNLQTICVQLSKFLGVFILFGLTWIFGALTAIEADQAFEVVFTVINSLQGFLIFIFFCALNNDVRLALSEKFDILHHAISTTGSKSNITSSQPESCGINANSDDDTNHYCLYPSETFSRTYSSKGTHMTELMTIAFESEAFSNLSNQY